MDFDYNSSHTLTVLMLLDLFGIFRCSTCRINYLWAERMLCAIQHDETKTVRSRLKYVQHSVDNHDDKAIKGSHS
jgi:hypothetical protein